MDSKFAGVYEIVKTCKGGLVLDLPAYDTSAPNRIVNFAYNITRIRVPRPYALGIFIDPTLERMYKAGLFKVEPAAEFEKEISAMFIPVIDKIVPVPEEDIIKVIKSGNRVKVKEWVESCQVNRDNLIVIARENIADISTSMVKDLEKLLGVELTIEDAE